MNPKREMLRDIQGHIDHCIYEITNAMKEYGYFYNLDNIDVKKEYDNYTEVYKKFPMLAKELLKDVFLETNGKVRPFEKSFVHYKKICSQFEYPNDRVLDPGID